MTAEIRKSITTAALDRTRLACVLGMLGSDHDGEVLNAARAAERMRREAGLTWPEILKSEAVPEPRAETEEERRRKEAAAEVRRQRREAKMKAEYEERARQEREQEAERKKRRRTRKEQEYPRTHVDKLAFLRARWSWLTPEQKAFIKSLDPDPAKHGPTIEKDITYIAYDLWRERAAPDEAPRPRRRAA
jgi:hypothetical protein